MIVKFVIISVNPDFQEEHVFECDSVTKLLNGMDRETEFTMHSKTHGEMKMSFPEDEMADVYYMSDSGKTIDTVHVHQVKINPKGLIVR